MTESFDLLHDLAGCKEVFDATGDRQSAAYFQALEQMLWHGMEEYWAVLNAVKPFEEWQKEQNGNS